MKPAAVILIIALLLTGALAGCKLSRTPPPEQPEPPEEIYIPAPAPQTVIPPEQEPVPAAKPAAQPAADLAQPLVEYIDEARRLAKKEQFADLFTPDGPLAQAELTLTLLESRLYQTRALHQVGRIAASLQDDDFDQAAKSLDRLIAELEPALQRPDDDDALSIESLQDALKAILDKKRDPALESLRAITEALAASPARQRVGQIRFDLHEAAAAAPRLQSLVLEAYLEDAYNQAADLEDILQEEAR